MKQLYCYADGMIRPIEEGFLPLTDLGIQRGYGVFDFFRVDRRKPLFLDDHLDRLFSSAEQLRLDGVITRDELIKLIEALTEKNDLIHSGMRIIISGGDAADGYSIKEPRISILQDTLIPPPEHLPMKGIRLASHPYQRQLSNVKTIDYLMAVWLQPWMKEQGADDILYHHDEKITECPRSNVFIITPSGTLVTPGEGMLAGITRKNILSVANQLKINTVIRSVTLQEVKNASGVFICSSTKRIMPVDQVDDKSVGSPTSRKIMERIWDALIEMEEAPH